MTIFPNPLMKKSLVARIEAVLRRRTKQSEILSEIFPFKGLTLNQDSYQLFYQGKLILFNSQRIWDDESIPK